MPKARETWHEVREDEDLPIIAAQYGIRDWKLIYDDSKNEELRKKRPDPYVLYKGDKVWIPEVEPKEFDAATNQRHRYVLYQPKQPLHVYMEDEDGSRRANRRYEIWIEGRRYHEGETREDGLIFKLVPLVPEVEIRLWAEKPEEAEDEELPDDEAGPDEGDEEDVVEYDWEEDYVVYRLEMAHLDPPDTVEGVQDRLSNLGYYIPDEEKGEPGEYTREALEEFQAAHLLEVTGEIDEPTRDLLVELHEKGGAAAESGEKTDSG